MFASVRESLSRVGRRPRLLAVAACLLLAALSAVDATRHGAPATAHPAGQTVPVLVAAHDLPAGRTLAHNDVAVARWPAGLRPPGAAARAAERVGSRLAGPVRAGEPITSSRLVGAALTDGLAPGVAAVPVSVPDPQAADLVRPGTEIELLATPRDDLDLGTRSDSDGSVTVVARRLLVLASLRGRDGDSSSLVVAADPAETLAVARAQSVGVFLAVPIAP